MQTHSRPCSFPNTSLPAWPGTAEHTHHVYVQFSNTDILHKSKYLSGRAYRCWWENVGSPHRGTRSCQPAGQPNRQGLNHRWWPLLDAAVRETAASLLSPYTLHSCIWQKWETMEELINAKYYWSIPSIMINQLYISITISAITIIITIT